MKSVHIKLNWQKISFLIDLPMEVYEPMRLKLALVNNVVYRETRRNVFDKLNETS
jgi:hypothetical protein